MKPRKRVNFDRGYFAKEIKREKKLQRKKEKILYSAPNKKQNTAVWLRRTKAGSVCVYRQRRRPRFKKVAIPKSFYQKRSYFISWEKADQVIPPEKFLYDLPVAYRKLKVDEPVRVRFALEWL